MNNEINILKWYPFEENAKVLEIFNKDSILDKINKNLDLKQSSIITGEKIEGQYDYITLIGTYAYAPLIIKKENPYVELLKILKQYLKENGKILLAIDNRMGIKYFSGAKSEYYSRLFEGLETKINQTKPNLLLKQELENFIKEAGFENYKFYYPLPDYTNTSSIFTDDFLPKSNHSKIVYPLNYEIDSNVVFNEINVIKQICDMGEFTKFTNSYFVEISNLKNENDIKFVNYNIFRKEKYQLILTMHNDKFEKKPSNALSKIHVQQINNYINTLKSLGFNILETVENECIVSEYIKEKELDKKIIELILKGKIDEAYDEIRKWYNYIKTRLESSTIEGQDIFQRYELEIPYELKERMQFIKDGFIDLSFENVFCKDGYLFYDQEWYLENIPIEFILYRAINNLYVYNCTELELKLTKDEILKEFGLKEFEVYFEKIENIIQKEILNESEIELYRKSLNEHCITIESLKRYCIQKTKEVNELQQEYQKIKNDKDKIITEMEKIKTEKENIQKEYDVLAKEYNTSRGWKVIKGVRKILGREKK